MNLLLRQGLRHHAHHPLQTLLTILGIAAGVALLVAMRLGQGTAERAFDRAIATIAGDATHTITAGPNGIAVSAYAAVRELLRGRGVAPTVQAVARVVIPEERIVLRVLGVDPLAEAEVRGWAAVGPAGALPIAALTTISGGFVATPELLARFGWVVGQQVPLRLGARVVTARCLGPLTAPPNARAGLADALVVDVATAQEWTGRLHSVDRLELRVAEARLAEAARALCGPAARLEAVGAQSGGLAALARGFRVNLTALSLLSLLVGAFLAHETMRLSVVARRSVFGVLRALGAHGRGLGAAVVAEALALGVAGSALGVLLGVVGADLLLTPIVRTLNFHYATFSLDAVEVHAGDLWLGGAVGVLVTLVAALGPAFAASRVTPREVLVPAREAGAAAWRWWWCVPPALLGTLLLATVGDRLIQAYLALLCLLLAAVAMVPAAMAALLAAIGAVWRRAGPFARYVVRSTAAARGHLALPLAAMALAVAATIGMAILVTSFRTSVAGWLGQVLPGDVYVSVPGGVDEKDQPLAEPLVRELVQLPEFADAVVYRRSRFWMQAGPNGGRIELVALRATPRFRDRFPLLRGDRDALADANGAWISEPLAFRWGLQVGDTFAITGERGAEPIRVAAVYRDYSNERGEVLVGEAWLAGRAELPVTALGLELRDGATSAAAIAHVQRTIAGHTEDWVQAREQGELRNSSLAIFDNTFAITGIMRLLCLGVAFVGIYAGFAALQLERGREVGLLRCLGARPAQIAIVVVGQTLLLGLCAALLALPLGLGIGQLLARVVNKVSFGWSLVDVTVPWAAVGEAMLLAVGAALLAGLQPAWRFARMRPAQNLREA
jgi:putative ABC transport system permease protein